MSVVAWGIAVPRQGSDGRSSTFAGRERGKIDGTQDTPHSGQLPDAIHQIDKQTGAVFGREKWGELVQYTGENKFASGLAQGGQHVQNLLPTI